MAHWLFMAFCDLQCGEIEGGGLRKYEFYSDLEERCDWDECGREDKVQGHLDLPNQLNIFLPATLTLQATAEPRLVSEHERRRCCD